MTTIGTNVIGVSGLSVPLCVETVCCVYQWQMGRSEQAHHTTLADISFQQFKWQLKAFLFGCWDHGALWL